MAGLDIRQCADGVAFEVKVVANSSRTEIAGRLGEMVKIKVACPAEKGKANQCLVEFLAGKLGVRKNAVSIISGHSSAVKKLQISGVSVEAAGRKLNGVLKCDSPSR